MHWTQLSSSLPEQGGFEGLRAAAISFWMGALLGGPRRKKGEPLPEDEVAAWRSRFGTLPSLLDEVDTEVEAWQSLEQRYLGGQTCLFEDAATEWARLEVHLDYVERMAEHLRPGLPEEGWAEWYQDEAEEPQPTQAGAARARFLADNARVKAFELLGERPRAAGIMARRLRQGPGTVEPAT